VLVERDVQLAELSRLLEGCIESRGATAVLRGPLAVGKTTLLRRFIEHAEAAGALVADAAGICPERNLPLGVLRQLFHGLHLGEAERLLAKGDLEAPCDPTVSTSGRLSSLSNRRLWAAVQALSECVPIVFTIDDLHYADDASLHTLEYFAGRVHNARVLIVATGAETPAVVDRLQGLWHTDLLRQREFHPVRVATLSEAGVAEVIAERMTPGDAERLARPWHRLTGGNPLLLMALLDDGRPGPEDTSDKVGAEYGKAVVACVRRGGRYLLNTARGLAALGSYASPARLSRLLDMPEGAVVQMVEALEATGVLAEGAFRHSSAPEALLADFPMAERVELHRATARILHHVGALPECVARHLVAAWHPDEDWAHDVLKDAAREALRGDELEFAMSCLDLAELAGGDEDGGLGVTILRTRVDFRNDLVAAFRRLDPLVRRLHQGELRSDLAAALIPALIWQGRADEAALAFRRLGQVTDDRDEGVTVEPGAVRGWTRFPPAPAAEGEYAPGSAPVLTVPGAAMLEGAAALVNVLRKGPADETVRSAERVLESLPLDDATFCAIQSALLALVYSDQTDLAAHWCDEMLRETSLRRATSWQALLAATRAEVSIRLGDLRAAQRHAGSALALIPARSWGVAIGLPLSSRMIAATGLGCDDGPEAVRAALPDTMYESRFGAQYLYARGQRNLSLGRLHAAHDDLFACGRLLQEWGIDLPAFVPWRLEAVQALLRLGLQDRAGELAAEQLTRPGVDRPRTRGIALRALAATAEPRRRPELLEEAADLLETGGDRAQLAYALGELSEAHRRLGQAGKARMAARRAERLAEECALAPLQKRLLAGGTGSGPLLAAPHPMYVLLKEGDLSAAERRVAELAAAGRTNREISAELFITVSTVEQHLTRVYRKLGVNGREDLSESSEGVRRSG
jgi:DNA-binding CsgD family transcriptional regulator